MLESREEAEAGESQTAGRAALLPMLQEAEARAGLAGGWKSQEPERRATPHRTPYLACFPASAPVPHAIGPVLRLPSPLWAA